MKQRETERPKTFFGAVAGRIVKGRRNGSKAFYLLLQRATPQQHPSNTQATPAQYLRNTACHTAAMTRTLARWRTASLPPRARRRVL